MDDKEKIAQKLRSGFFEQIVLTSQLRSSDLHSDYVEYISVVATEFRNLLQNQEQISALQYEPKVFWPNQKGREFVFIDGGVANVSLPSAEPLGIRVGAYFVRPGDESDNRERFTFAVQLVDELFAKEPTVFEDVIADTSKLRDAGRIACETAAAYGVAKSEHSPYALFIHGPLVNPVSPYGLSDFPAFTSETYNYLLQRDDGPTKSRDERHFMSVYRQILEDIRQTDVPAFGVIERAAGATPGVVTRALLHGMVEEGCLTSRDAQRLTRDFENYRITDGVLFGLCLHENEFLQPITVSKQGPKNKWPEDWYYEIVKYPTPLVTYIKVSEDSVPVRVETLKQYPEALDGYAMVLHMSRLLPRYSFPAGLDIVDKYAKVPEWISRGIRKQHATVLLRRAIESGDREAVNFAKRVLMMRGRDWFYRP